MIKLIVQNETGHTELQLASSEVIEQIDTHPTHWVFVDDIMVSRETINEINWDEVSEVQLTPAIVGGQ
jgi:hypothetical protein|tara:strand:- start:2569 stop:2772 length:204 start_codon:yes stop_codon:yes gene_type:complete